MAVTIDPKIQTVFPLSPLQEGLHYVKMRYLDEDPYVIQNILLMKGDVDSQDIVRAMQLLTERHAALRTLFVSRKTTRVLQAVLRERPMECTVISLTGEDREEQQLMTDKLAMEDIRRGFDLETDTLMRTTIIRLDRNTHKIIWTFHHIIMDGWSVRILQRDFRKDLESLLAGRSGRDIRQEMVRDLKDRPEYADYVRRIREQSSEAGLDFWRTHLEGYEGGARIRDFSPWAEPVSAEDEYYLTLDFKLFERVKRYSQQTKTPISLIFEGVWGLVLRKYTGLNDIVFGKVVAGRNVPLPGITEMVGLFINTIPVRMTVSPNMSFHDLLEVNLENFLLSMEFDYLPLGSIQQLTNAGSDLIQTAFVLENFQEQQEENQELLFDLSVVHEKEKTNYDLTLSVILSDRIRIKLMYHTQKYCPEIITAIAASFEEILGMVLDDPQKSLTGMTFTSEASRRYILDHFCCHEVVNREYNSIMELFQEQAARNPGKTGIQYGKIQLAYQEIDRKTNALAHKLLRLGLGRDRCAGIMLKREPGAILAILAVLKAGGCFVPVDPTLPLERINYILADCRPVLLITGADCRDMEDSFPAECAVYRLTDEEFREEASFGPESGSRLSDLAYIIYTSGTTGRPKGVMVEQRGLINLQQYFIRNFDISPADRVLQFANLIFDASVWEICMALFTGATLVMLPEDCQKDVNKFENYCRDFEVTVATLPPFFYLQTEKFSPRLLITAGSATNTDILKKTAAQGIRYVNAYGPTESTVCATHWEEPDEQVRLSSKLTIGSAIDNAAVYILDGNRQLCDVGMMGELCIGGIGTARGYLGQKELTEDKFIENPFAPGKRLYRSGDSARWLTDGNIEFLGRIDQQLKIRGFRIEPGEIEETIRKTAGVRDVLVIARKIYGEEKLCAYFTAEAQLDSMQIKRTLEKKLPAYMIPSYLTQLDWIPLNRSGKVDEKQLPEEGKVCQEEYAAPVTETERLLAGVFMEVLQTERLGINDSLFRYGMDSLTVIRAVIAATRKNVEITVQNIYDHPTIASLAARLEKGAVSEYTLAFPEKYQVYDPLLQKNTISAAPECRPCPMKNILLTGATGFLGIHILGELVRKTEAVIHCLIRGGDREAAREKAVRALAYYYDREEREDIWKRIRIVTGDITDGEALDCESAIDTIIHAAANIKHFGQQEEFFLTNVTGTENLLRLARKKQARFLYISTTSTSGIVLEESVRQEYSERDFYVGQLFTSPYIRTKFEAEERVLQARSAGLKACIIRVGNLTNRTSDLKPMPDIESNRFLSLLRSFLRVGYVSRELLEDPMEFLPVDQAAAAVAALCRHDFQEYSVFHLARKDRVKFRNIYEGMKLLGKELRVIPHALFVRMIEDTLKDDQTAEIYQTITRTDVYDIGKPVRLLNITHQFTDWYLEKCGCRFPEADQNYINAFLKYYQGINYFC